MIVSSMDGLEALRTCFQEGALDYLTKPFTRNEFLVKLERLLAKSSQIALDPASFHLKRNGVELPQLTPRELQVFTVLQSAGWTPVSRQRLQAEIWGDAVVSPKSLDVHLFHQRKKLAQAGVEIRFQPNQGFVLQEVTAPSPGA
jgi:DNA-binding response OmpR family regulator